MKFVYKNIGCIPKTLYGVEFKPGEAKEVPGYVNDPNFIKLDKLPELKETKAVDKSTANKQKQPDKVENTPESKQKSEAEASDKNNKEEKQ